jgi:hypothetical protein
MWKACTPSLPAGKILFDSRAYRLQNRGMNAEAQRRRKPEKTSKNASI